MRTLLASVAAALALLACRASVPRYIVTTAPIDVGIGSRLCIAAAPEDVDGIWWWEPGRSRCSSRSTPDVFRAEGASVRAQRDRVDLSFRLQLHASPASMAPAFVDVALVLDGDGMLAPASGMRVPTVRRDALELTEEPGAQR